MVSVAQFRSRLLAWYDTHRRALAWRALEGQAVDPYRVWLSEVMLQQTTVAHATAYFQAFTARWPTVRDLAAAEDGEVMAAWAGLGYYARARNLLACAREVARTHGGEFPDQETVLRTLPGLGAYTAAAVAAIAFNRPANVVDGNVERVMARLFTVEEPVPAGRPKLSRLAAGFVTDDRPGDWAQALMDLGATVCRPRGPLCDSCPVDEMCAARAQGAPETYPRKAAKAERPRRRGVVFAAIESGRVALVRRPPKGLLGGMLGLPTTPWRAAAWTTEDALSHAPLAAAWTEAGFVEHVFTHFSLELKVLVANVPSRAVPGPAEFVWASTESALTDTPSVFRKALERALG